MKRASYQYLIDPHQTRKALMAFANQPIIGLDTETFWDYETRQNHLSLLQLAAPTGEVVVIDGLSAGIEEARTLIEDPSAMMAAHNARFDDGVLRQAGFAVSGMVDTLKLARRTLRLRSFSLSSVSNELCGMPLDKTHQRSDWRRRPLSREQLDYAALDAQVALEVFEKLTARLEDEGRLNDELDRARILPLSETPEEKKRAKSRALNAVIETRPLTADEQKLVEKLKQWRRQLAHYERIAAYQVCPDRTLEHLILIRPRSLEDLTKVFGMNETKIARYGEEILKQLDQL